MKSRVLKKNEKCYLQLPPEFAGVDEIEVFQLREGYYLLSVPLEAAPRTATETQQVKAQEGNSPNEKEKSLLRKLGGVKFENRTPAYVSKYFTDSEQKMLVEIEKKGYINLFRGKKYADGVYNISDRMFQLMKEAPQKELQQPAGPQSDSPLAALFKTGYAVLANNNQAYEFSESLRNAGKNNDVLGIKGFDGKYYVVSKNYFTEMSYLIKNSVRGEMTVASIAKLCKTDETGSRAVLMLMAERGDAVEKKKDSFALV